jgi:hypothetical protein
VARVVYTRVDTVPRVPDEYLDCVVYLYPSIPDANAGKKLGGSGFIVRVDEAGMDFYYVVTNRHVVEAGSTTVRFNTPSETHIALECDEREWILDTHADLAVYLLPDPDPRSLRIRPIEVSHFITEEQLKRLDIGIGSEVFFAGRFINVEGRAKNRPSLRFGTIAQAGTEIIDNQESLVVEARSIPGFSGSPVFVYIPTNSPLSVASSGLRTQGVGPFLLGVDWAHINDYGDAIDDRGNELPYKIRMNSGMMAVVPVQKLLDLLYRQDVMNVRDKYPRS